jgi:hypothetical protein
LSKKGEEKGPDIHRWNELRSFTQGLYEEMDKLAKKAPSALLSDLATQRVNRAILDAKTLMESFDTYVSDLKQFVPAGNNPEVGDALLMLREITQALERVNERFGIESQLLEW